MLSIICHRKCIYTALFSNKMIQSALNDNIKTRIITLQLWHIHAFICSMQHFKGRILDFCVCNFFRLKVQLRSLVVNWGQQLVWGQVIPAQLFKLFKKYWLTETSPWLQGCGGNIRELKLFTEEWEKNVSYHCERLISSAKSGSKGYWTIRCTLYFTWFCLYPCLTRRVLNQLF